MYPDYSFTEEEWATGRRAYQHLVTARDKLNLAWDNNGHYFDGCEETVMLKHFYMDNANEEIGSAIQDLQQGDRGGVFASLIKGLNVNLCTYDLVAKCDIFEVSWKDREEMENRIKDAYDRVCTVMEAMERKLGIMPAEEKEITHPFRKAMFVYFSMILGMGVVYGLLRIIFL